MSNCVFSSNSAANNGGGMLNSGSSPVVSSCTFSSNYAGFNGGGMYYTNSSGGSITNAIFYGNTDGNGNNNRQNIFKVSSGTLTVSYSLIGDYSATAINNYTASNVITGDPLFVNAATPAGADGIFRTADDGLLIGCGSAARDAGTGTTPSTDILGNSRVGVIDMGAYEADASCSNIIYVDDSRPDNSGNGYSWAYAKKDVQAGINAVAAGGEVWVKTGTYSPTEDLNGNAAPADNRDKTFYLTTKDIKLYGGFAGNETANTQRNAATNVTTLSGDLDGSGGMADAYHVVVTGNRTTACVVDGFTISGGRGTGSGPVSVSSPAATFYRSDGGGMDNYNSSPTVSNCTFSTNSATTFGGGMYNYISTPQVSNCTFKGNITGERGGGIANNGGNSTATVRNCVFAGNTAGVYGGGMFNDGSSPQLSSCVFSGNSSNGHGGGMLNLNGSNPVLTGCTFSGNTATASNGGGGIHYAAGCGGSITNSILYGNTGGLPNRENLYKDNTASTLIVSNSLIGDYSAGATNNYTATNVFAGDPLFVDATNPAGTDGTFRTADDGLMLQTCSPALNSGTGATPATDILGNSRVGTMDMGAYEYQGSAANSATLATASSTENQVQASGSATTYGDCGGIVATILSTGAAPVSGSVTAKVYVQSSIPVVGQTPYVRRFYDITPATNPNTATAQITLYFTKADFSTYNSVRGSYPSLPIDANDVAGYKANIRITQEHGTSATGLPNSYSGWGGVGPSKVLITPTSVVWNSTVARWEVTFPVTGFSGFFLHSATNSNVPLPVKLFSFGAQKVGEKKNRIVWETAQEEEDTRYTVERSGDGKTFTAIGEVKGKGSRGVYTLDDSSPLVGDNFYRLHIQENSGESYSKIVLVSREETRVQAVVTVFPNPATEEVTISCENENLWGKEAQIVSMDGRTQARVILGARVTMDVRDWAAGAYLLRLPNGGAVRIVKQ